MNETVAGRVESGAQVRVRALSVCRLPLPNEIAKTFEESFGDKEFAAQARQDPLVVLDAPRLCFMLSLLRAIKPMLPRAKQLTTPWLVCCHTDIELCPIMPIVVSCHDVCRYCMELWTQGRRSPTAWSCTAAQRVTTGA